MTAQAGSDEGKDWVSSYCPNTNESSLHFRTDCIQWEQALLCDGTPESWAGRGRQELVLRVRNWTRVGEGRVQVHWVLGGVEAPILRGSVSEGQFLASLSSFLLVCVPPFPTGPGPTSTSGIQGTSPTPSEGESETSRVSGHPRPTRPVATLLQAALAGHLWVSGRGRVLRKRLVGQAALSRRGGWCHIPLWHARLLSYVEAKRRGRRWEETGAWPGFPAPQGSPALVWLITFGQVRWLGFVRSWACGRLSQSPIRKGRVGVFFLELW